MVILLNCNANFVLHLAYIAKSHVINFRLAQNTDIHIGPLKAPSVTDKSLVISIS